MNTAGIHKVNVTGESRDAVLLAVRQHVQKWRTMCMAKMKSYKKMKGWGWGNTENRTSHSQLNTRNRHRNLVELRKFNSWLNLLIYE
jgi:hypothetical protein